MNDLLYSSSVISILFSVIMLLKFEKHHTLNFISRSVLILSCLIYLITFFIFSTTLSFKLSILLRDVTIVAGFIFLFRTIRDQKFLFYLVFAGVIGLVNNFGLEILSKTFETNSVQGIEGETLTSNQTTKKEITTAQKVRKKKKKRLKQHIKK